MNKYRLLGTYDDFNTFVCLACKGEFIHRERPADWKCCPLCLVVWDGEFTKRNKEPQPYVGFDDDSYTLLPDGSMICHKPRLILQTRQFVTSRLSPNSFSVEQTSPHWTPWRLISHCRLDPNITIDGQSVSVHMFKTFKGFTQNQHYQALRLILQTGTEIRVIKEYAR